MRYPRELHPEWMITGRLAAACAKVALLLIAGVLVGWGTTALWSTTGVWFWIVFITAAIGGGVALDRWLIRRGR